VDDYTEQMIEQRIAELSDAEFDAMVARTRSPRLTKKDHAAAQLAAHLANK